MRYGPAPDRCDKLRAVGERSEKKLSNPKFIENAPEDVVQLERERLAETSEALQQLQARHQALSDLL